MRGITSFFTYCLLRSFPATLRFFPSFAKTLTPLFDSPRRTLSSERVVRFVSAFASHRDGSDAAASDAFSEEFLRFLIAAAAAAHRPARFRSCQIISEIIMYLPDDAEVSDEVWDEVIDSMKVRVRDKIPAIRVFAVRALSRFAIEGDDAQVLDLFLQTLVQEQNAAEVAKVVETQNSLERQLELIETHQKELGASALQVKGASVLENGMI